MKESTKQRRAFNLYLQLGSTRSLEELWLALGEDPSRIGLRRGPSRRTIENWSAALHWQDRVQELERRASERDREGQLEALREMDERHSQEGLALQQKGIGRLQALEPSEMTANDAIRSVAEGVRIERLARGAAARPASADEEDGDSNDSFEDFSEEELRRLATLGERRAQGAGETEAE